MCRNTQHASSYWDMRLGAAFMGTIMLCLSFTLWRGMCQRVCALHCAVVRGGATQTFPVRRELGLELGLYCALHSLGSCSPSELGLNPLALPLFWSWAFPSRAHTLPTLCLFLLASGFGFLS